MSLTLLGIANAVADETKGPRPATIVGNTEPDAQNILRIINKIGSRIMRMYDWNVLRKEYTFSSPGVETLIASADMPSDFDRFVPETFWNRSSSELITGPISPIEWSGLKGQSNSSQINTKFIYRGGNVLSVPTIDSGASMAFEYVSKNWCEDTDGTSKSTMTVDTDATLLDGELIVAMCKYEWLKDEGQPSQEAGMSARDILDTLTGHDAASENIAVSADLFSINSRHFSGAPPASRTTYTGY